MTLDLALSAMSRALIVMASAVFTVMDEHFVQYNKCDTIFSFQT
jgi:hypothetical protein